MTCEMFWFLLKLNVAVNILVKVVSVKWQDIPQKFTVNHTNLKLSTKWNLCSNAGAYVIGKKENVK